MTGINISTLPKIKIDISDHPFIKDDIFEVTVDFTPRGTPFGLVARYCEYHNMSYISQSTNNILCNLDLPLINMTGVCILSIVRKYPKTVQLVLESISSQKLTRKYNRFHFITLLRGKNIFRTNIQENRYISSQ